MWNRSSNLFLCWIYEIKMNPLSIFPLPSWICFQKDLSLFHQHGTPPDGHSLPTKNWACVNKVPFSLEMVAITMFNKITLIACLRLHSYSQYVDPSDASLRLLVAILASFSHHLLVTTLTCTLRALTCTLVHLCTCALAILASFSHTPPSCDHR